ncbi:hypothetical protein [Paraburkholderia azotifigens]|uniref:Transposase n=1 Tax=Paraburkholderia azotifigens TaxID=2057004 RepID=A0ABU9RF95_9BURK|nr:hypothetical protein [Paraburkholderia azotifigens]
MNVHIQCCVMHKRRKSRYDRMYVLFGVGIGNVERGRLKAENPLK